VNDGCCYIYTLKASSHNIPASIQLIMSQNQRALALLNELINSHESNTESGKTFSYDTSVTSACNAVTMLDTLIFEMETSLATSNASELLACLPAPGPKKVKEPKASSKKKAVPPPAPACSDEITVNSLDLRVGQIVKVEVHPTADKLYCEDIDVGEEAPRQIASGLVPYYTLEQMQGKRLIVVCNLKPRSLVGFKSNGMVLCASIENADGTRRVEFVDPPADAPLGSRVFAPTLGGNTEPLSANQCDKKKGFILVAPDLCINGEGSMEWKGTPITCNGAPCTAPNLRNCPVA
jgi:aminoacyl tRNA synthase complex-interacting multifunctional protein 1